MRISRPCLLLLLCFFLGLGSIPACKSQEQSLQKEQEPQKEQDPPQREVGGLGFSLSLTELKLQEGEPDLSLEIKIDTGRPVLNLPLRLEITPGPHIALALGGADTPSIESFRFDTYDKSWRPKGISIEKSSEFKGLGFLLKKGGNEGQPLEIEISVRASERWGYKITKDIQSHIEFKLGYQREGQEFEALLVESQSLPVEIEAAAAPASELLSRGAKNYVLAFEDDFSGTKLDSEKWIVLDDQLRRSCVSTKDNIRVADGFLEIIFSTNADKTTCNTAFVISKLVGFKRGYYEFRVRPQIQSGFWAALWLNGPSGHDELEIDILEYYCLKTPCQRGRHYNVLHWYTSDNRWTNPNIGFNRDNSAYTAENVPLMTVALEWSDSGYSFYVDGVETASSTATSLITTLVNGASVGGRSISGVQTTGTTQGEAIRNEIVPQEIILSVTSELYRGYNSHLNWGGTTNDASYPASFYIDYVRYYEPVEPVE